MATPTTSKPAIPVLLLKTKSSPGDAYEDHFADAISEHGTGFDPIFVPVLEHRFDDAGIGRLRDVLIQRRVSLAAGPAKEGAYGGLIFTSQRAVEAFAQVVAQGDAESGDPTAWPHLQDVPIYSVGPATTRALKAVSQQPPLQVVGDHAGNGEDLAYFIREHYVDAQPAPTSAMPPLLFLVGEKRRDIIPRVLMGGRSEGTCGNAPIQVDEVVVYGTGVMASFADDLERVLAATKDRPMRWVVVFSPTGCDSMLASLGLLDPATRRVHSAVASPSSSFSSPSPLPSCSRTTYVATIGPTTRAYLRDTFGFEPDVCADEPTPAGVVRGIANFMAAQSSGR